MTADPDPISTTFASVGCDHERHLSMDRRSAVHNSGSTLEKDPGENPGRSSDCDDTDSLSSGNFSTLDIDYDSCDSLYLPSQSDSKAESCSSCDDAGDSDVEHSYSPVYDRKIY